MNGDAMRPRDFFHHCPRCGVRQTAPPKGNVFTCAGCGFRLFFNPAVATAAIITDAAGRILCIRRARDPERGRLAFPGGFIDIGEVPEQALRREIREEVGLEVGGLEFLCSCTNDYPYDGIRYPVVDLIFHTSSTGSDVRAAAEEVESIAWIGPEFIAPEDLAFPSLREGLRLFLSMRRKAAG
jgi:mutator protein MutT